MIQPYAVIFNEDKCTEKDTGIFLISDYNSSIYEVQIFLSDKKEMMRSRFGAVLKLKPDIRRKTTTDHDNTKFNFLEMDRDDRITDFKLFTKGDKILLLANIVIHVIFFFIFFSPQKLFFIVVLVN